MTGFFLRNLRSFSENVFENTSQKQSNFIEITFWHGCSHINLLHIFRTPFPKNTSGELLLFVLRCRLAERVNRNLKIFLRLCSPRLLMVALCNRKYVHFVFFFAHVFETSVCKSRGSKLYSESGQTAKMDFLLK